jgi:hypothetical protein
LLSQFKTKRKNVKTISKLAALCSTLLFATSAFAGVIGTATVNDVSLDGSVADAFKFSSGVNPQAGPNGTTTGFKNTFSGFGTSNPWAVIAKFTSSADNNFAIDTAASLPYSFEMTFDKTDSRNGSWTIQNKDTGHDVILDLAFAMYSGNSSAAWLFDNQVLAAGASLAGTWSMNLKNNGGNYGGYSNLTLFARDVVQTAVAHQPLGNAPAAVDVPEPGALALLLMGLGMMALSARRRSK